MKEKKALMCDLTNVVSKLIS